MTVYGMPWICYPRESVMELRLDRRNVAILRFSNNGSCSVQPSGVVDMILWL